MTAALEFSCQTGRHNYQAAIFALQLLFHVAVHNPLLFCTPLHLSVSCYTVYLFFNRISISHAMLLEKSAFTSVHHRPPQCFCVQHVKAFIIAKSIAYAGYMCQYSQTFQYLVHARCPWQSSDALDCVIVLMGFIIFLYLT